MAHTVDRYWNENPVRREPFESAEQSLEHLEWRFAQYPLFREYAGLWGDHDGQVVLDYGCGPGNDVTGFLVHTGAEKVIGVDVAHDVLNAARARIALHDVPEERYELIEVTDSDPRIPLPDDSIDYLQCQGVLQHTSDPLTILRELHRVLKPNREARVMVYNRDSVWLHLYVAHVVQLVQGRYADLPVEEAFARTTDGENCPIARCWRPADFADMCREAGFDPEFLGGYPSLHELQQIDENLESALRDERLGPDHRSFLSELEFDGEDHPIWRGKHSGVGASYLLRTR